MAYKRDINAFVGTRTGVFKGVKLCDTVAIEKNFSGLKLNPLQDEITAVGWGDSDEKDVLLGLVNQTVKIYNSESQTFTSCMNVKCGEGSIRGISRYSGSILTAVESGEVNLWEEGSTARLKQSIKTCSHIERMRHNLYDKEIVAVGGKESNLSLWNLEASEKCIFTAKNVPHNHLQLRVPVWVSDMAFMPNSQKIATCSRYGHLRLYDPKAQRRPVINMDVPEQALTCISACSRENHVIVGSGTGLMMLVDLRGKGLQLNHYKGFAGGVRDIVCHQTEPYILSVSLDRYLRLHHLESKAILHKVYLKSKLNCVLMRSDFSLTDLNEESSDEDGDLNELKIQTDVQDTAEASKEMDIIFSEMDSAAKNSQKKSKSKMIKPLESHFQSKRKLELSALPPQKRKKKTKK